MRINDAYTRGVAHTPQTAPKPPTQPRSAEAPAEPDGGVRVQFSAQSRALALQAGGDVDTARVERLKAAIASGNFQVDAAAIADKILQGG